MENNKELIKTFQLSLFLMLSLVVISGCGRGNGDEVEEIAKKQVKVQIIEKQNQVTTDLTVSGTIIPREYAVIRSLTPGIIEYVVPVGFQISVGQPLFKIRDDNVENNYFNAQQNFRQTEILANQRVSQAELALKSAQARLDLAQRNLDTAVLQSEQNFVNSQDSAVIEYNSTYNTLNQFFIFVSAGELTNDTFIYRNVGTSQLELRGNTELFYLSVVKSFLKLSNSVTLINLDQSLNEMTQILAEAKLLVDSTVILLQNTLGGVADLASDKTTISGYQTTINAHANSILASQNALRNTVINNNLAVDQSDNQLTLALIEFNNSQISLSNAQQSSQLEKNISQGQLDNASYSFNNLSLASPFSGTILSAVAEAGQQISVGQEILELGNLSIVQIRAEIDTEFARGLKQGDQVRINELYDGHISEIEPTGNIVSGKIGITIQSDNSEGFLVAGDIAEVEFSLIYNEPEVIVIPINAASIEVAGNYVFVNVEGTVVKHSVTLGRIFGNRVTIISGLNEGDELILRNGVFISEGDELEVVE